MNALNATIECGWLVATASSCPCHGSASALHCLQYVPRRPRGRSPSSGMALVNIALFIGRPADSTHRHGLDYHPDMTTIATRCRFAQCSFSARGWVGQRRSVYRRHNGLPAQFVCSVTACDTECASCIWDILFEAVLDMPP